MSLTQLCPGDLIQANMPSVHSHQTHCSGIDFTSFLATVDLSQIPSIESQRNENGRTEELQHIVFHQLPDMVSGALDESSCVVATSRGIYLPVSMREENAEYSTSIAWYPPHIDVGKSLPPYSGIGHIQGIVPYILDTFARVLHREKLYTCQVLDVE